MHLCRTMRHVKLCIITAVFFGVSPRDVSSRTCKSSSEISRFTHAMATPRMGIMALRGGYVPHVPLHRVDEEALKEEERIRYYHPYENFSA